jgi:hypothetical protein
VMQQYKNCWERRLLQDPCRGYVRSRLCDVSSAVGSPLLQLGTRGDSQREREAVNREVEGSTALETVTRQRLMMIQHTEKIFYVL